MRRGDIWIGSSHGAYIGKPRPQLIVQNDRVGGFESIMVCPISATPTESGPLRLRLEPNIQNGLRRESWIMVDKLSAVPVRKLDEWIGVLASDEMDQVSSSLVDLLGLDR